MSNVGNIGATSVVPVDSFVNPVKVLGQSILDKIKEQHIDNISCHALTPQDVQAIHADLQALEAWYREHQPAVLDRYIRATQHQINSRNN